MSDAPEQRDPDSETLGEALAAAGVNHIAVARLARYGEDLLSATASVNLTGARSTHEIAGHILDALTLVPFMRGRFVDVGSGGGFPGLPLAILTGYAGLLVEPTRKRAAFLTREVEALSLSEVSVVADRAEQAGRMPEHRERYLTATARAVGGPTEVLELTMPFLAVGGVALLQRGRAEAWELAALDDAALVLSGRVREIVRAGGERRVIVVEKIAPISPRFPRRTGIPAKRPLCVSPSNVASLA